MEQISQNSVKTNGAYKITLKKIMRAALAEVRVHKKLAVISFVLYGVSFLLFTFNADLYSLHRSIDFTNSPYTPETIPTSFTPSGWGAFFLVMGIIVGFFAVLNIFRDMSNGQHCDVSMALPIKASERFFSKLIALFIMQTAPLIVSALGGNSLAVLYGVMTSPNGMEESTAKNLFMLFLAALAGSMFIMAITVLCACCCGAMAESAYFSIIAMGIINGLPLAFLYNIVFGSAGFSDGIASIFWGDSSMVDLGWWGFLFFTRIEADDMIIHCVVGCLISLAVMLLSGIIYKKRDARSVGTPIASKVFFEVMMAGGCVTIFSLFAMQTEAVWGVLIAGVAYVIINIIVCRAKINALSFLKWAGKYAATLAAFTVVLVITIKTGGFGLISARPDTKYLEGTEFIVGFRETKYDDDGDRYYGWTNIYTQALEPEQADEVLETIQKHVIKGSSEISVFNKIFGIQDYPSENNINIRVVSETEYGFRPSPKFMFDKHISYVKSLDTYVTSYRLDYFQNLSISQTELDALIEELNELGFQKEKQPEKFDYYSNADTETVS